MGNILSLLLTKCQTKEPLGRMSLFGVIVWGYSLALWNSYVGSRVRWMSCLSSIFKDAGNTHFHPHTWLGLFHFLSHLCSPVCFCDLFPISKQVIILLSQEDYENDALRTTINAWQSKFPWLRRCSVKEYGVPSNFRWHVILDEPTIVSGLNSQSWVTFIHFSFILIFNAA